MSDDDDYEDDEYDDDDEYYYDDDYDSEDDSFQGLRESELTRRLLREAGSLQKRCQVILGPSIRPYPNTFLHTPTEKLIMRFSIPGSLGHGRSRAKAGSGGS